MVARKMCHLNYGHLRIGGHALVTKAQGDRVKHTEAQAMEYKNGIHLFADIMH